MQPDWNYFYDELMYYLAVYYGDSDHPISGQIDPGVS
ncbi:hypothetical protein SAMN05192573_108108 [Mucilaginibacter gossypii]|uniref:Uncharacterized protein n=1 Tax=Mucilaginibacter gossypii TaxID=551996 RepID=A0A1G8B6X5_9SPHI|nr:hypothetical protein SAMN05192573_108108 [Mucilaginibacter gossypii]